MSEAGQSSTGHFGLPRAMLTETSVAHVILRALAPLGIDTVLGIPGGGISPLYDALLDFPDIRVIHTRHESNAAFMASGAWYGARKRVCVCVTSGPGFTNVLTGLASAHLNDVPLLLLVGEVSTAKMGRGALQDGSPAGLDVARMLESCTRYVAVVDGSTPLERILDDVHEILLGTRPGPCALILPLDRSAGPADDDGGAVQAPTPRPPPPAPPPLAQDQRQQLLDFVDELRDARRPLLVLGRGCHTEPRIEAGLAALVRTLDVPVAVTPRAKGIVPEDLPGYLGIIGYGGHPAALHYVQEGVDVLLVLGSDLGEASTNAWTLPLSETKIGAVWNRPIHDAYPLAMELQASMLQVLPALEPVQPRPRTAPWSRPRTTTALTPPKAGLSPQEIIAAIQGAFRRTGRPVHYFTDIGEHMFYAVHHLEIGRGERFNVDMGFGTMGSGIGAAMGAKLALPEHEVVCFCGDYGFQMFGMDLVTCLEREIAVTFVIFNDHRMRMVEQGLLQIYGRRGELSGRAVPFGQLAEVHGARSAVITTAEELAAFVPDPQDPRPMVVDVAISPEHYFAANARATSIASTPGIRKKRT